MTTSEYKCQMWNVKWIGMDTTQTDSAQAMSDGRSFHRFAPDTGKGHSADCGD